MRTRATSIGTTEMPGAPSGYSSWCALYCVKETMPGILAMVMIAMISNGLPGVPFPFTMHNLFAWLDRVIGPIYGQSFFQLLNMNFVTVPILMGMLIGNIFGVPDSWKKGLSYIHILMPLGIIMLGPHFMIFDAFKIGPGPLALITLFVFLSATLTLLVSKWLNLDDRHGSILAGGLATGDPHASVILMPLIKAKGGQVVHAVVSLILFGLVASLVLPALGHWLGIPEKWFGLAGVVGVGNGRQAVLSGYLYGFTAGKYVSYFDVGRHVLVPVGFLYVFVVVFIRSLRHQNSPGAGTTRGGKGFPLFAWIFIIVWGLSCLHVFKEPAHKAIFNLVVWDFSMAASALGLSIRFRDVTSLGWRGVGVTCVSGFIRMGLLMATVWGLVRTGIFPG